MGFISTDSPHLGLASKFGGGGIKLRFVVKNRDGTEHFDFHIRCEGRENEEVDDDGERTLPPTVATDPTETTNKKPTLTTR